MSRLVKQWIPTLIATVTGLIVLAGYLFPGQLFQQMLNYVIGPLGASLAGLLVFTLTLAAFRLLRVRRSVGAVLFVLIVAVVLLGSTPFVGLEWLADARDWIISVPGMAGGRGLLLGVALGTMITALRVLMGSDRPHSEF